MKQFEQQFNHLVATQPHLFLLATIICAALLQGILTVAKANISHDETISYLSATVRQGDFERIFRNNEYPANHWAFAGEWKAWFAIDKPLAFRQIGLDLAESDIHPPLYFWALHVWTWLFEVHPWTGPTLNIMIQAVGAFGLFHLACQTLKDNFEAVAVVFIWSVSPAVLTAALEARQYTLLAVCTIFFLWLIVVAVNPSKSLASPIWVLLAVATATGALTHFHFALIVVGGFLIFGLRLLRHDVKRAVFVGTAVLAGYLLSFVLHPQFYRSVQELGRRQALEAQHLSSRLAILQRLYAVGNTFTGFWIVVDIAQVILFCLATASAIWLVWVLLKNPERVRQFVQTHNFEGYEVGLFFGWIGGISILLYLTFVSPVHAMMERHMSAVWPFFPFLPILLLRTVRVSLRQRIMVLLGTAVLFSGVVSVWQGVQMNQLNLHNEDARVDVDRIVADGVYQGILPRIFLQLPDDALIFVATQDELLAAPEAWVPQLEASTVYISELSYDNTISQRDQILTLLEQRFETVLLPNDSWGIGRRYFLKPLN